MPYKLNETYFKAWWRGLGLPALGVDGFWNHKTIRLHLIFWSISVSLTGNA